MFIYLFIFLILFISYILLVLLDEECGGSVDACPGGADVNPTKNKEWQTKELSVPTPMICTGLASKQEPVHLM